MRPRFSPAIPTKVPLPSRGFSGVDERTAMRRATSPCLPAEEPGRALLEERARALLVVGAPEGLDGLRAQLLAVGLGDAVEDGVDLGLGPADGERRVGGDDPQVVVGVLLEVVGRREALDEADAERLLVVE